FISGVYIGSLLHTYKQPALDYRKADNNIHLENDNFLIRAKEKYIKDRDYISFCVLVKQLEIGMIQTEVENLLGEPDYSPIDGEYYYYSGKENSENTSIGLILEYRIDDRVTGKLESFSLTPIGE